MTSRIIHSIESFDARNVRGWAFDQDNPNQKLLLRARAKEFEDFYFHTEEQRDDVNEVYGVTHSGFYTRLPAVTRESVTLHALSKNADSYQECFLGQVQPQLLVGRVEACDGLLIKGWIHSYVEKIGSARIKCRLGGIIVAEASADIHRADVAEHFGTEDARCGFEVVLPQKVLFAEADELRLFADINGEEYPIRGTIKPTWPSTNQRHYRYLPETAEWKEV